MILSIFRHCTYTLLLGLTLFASALTNAEQQLTSPPPVKAPGKLAIIIDDIGYNLPLGKRAAELPGPITYAVLPHTPVAKKLAFYATQLNTQNEIIVHMPMESHHGKRLGPGGLTADFSQQEFISTLRSALNELPFARGLSNHMGSHLTTLPDRMHWLMEELSAQGLYFVDSKTTQGRTSWAAANRSQVPYIARDVFLDHDPKPEAIAAAFQKALRLAKRSGLAVVIAHPYPSTLTFLEHELLTIKNQGVNLVNASEALAWETEHRLDQKTTLTHQKHQLKTILESNFKL